MSYKFVKITSFYRDYITQYYNENSDILNLSYDEQYVHLMKQGYAWADYFAVHLKRLGVDAYEIVYNARPLQEAWARENGSSAKGMDIIIDQLKSIKPDVVFFQDSFKFLEDWVAKLKEEVPSIKLTIGFCCTNFNELYLKRFKSFDFLVVCSDLFAKAFKEYGLNVYTIIHAFETSILDKISVKNNYPESDIIFLGSFVPGHEGHDLRQIVVNNLLNSNIKLDLYSQIRTTSPFNLILQQSAFVAANLLKNAKLSSLARILPGIKKAYWLNAMPVNPKNISLIKKNSKKPVYGLEMFKALSRSKIGFNYHGHAAGDYAANMRLFEVTGVGSCLITDWKKNLNDMFKIDEEVVAFKTAEECVEKVKWLLNNPEKREAIAKAGQRRVLKDHTLKSRVQLLNEIIQTELNNKRK